MTDVLNSDETNLQGLDTSMTIRRVAAAIVVVTISGRDVGTWRCAVQGARRTARKGEGPFSLFIDARRTKGASVDVSNVWARWLRTHRDDLLKIHMLTGSRFVQMTADFVRRFAELGDAMLIYTEPSVFDEALESATQRR
jgi:hypothetical protein